MIGLNDLLGRLQGVTGGSGGQYMARCPAHDDKRASLAVCEGEKGILLHCMAGCETERIVETLGIKMGDLMREDRPAETPRKRSPGKKAAPEKPGQDKPAGDAPKKKTPADLSTLRVGGEYVRKIKGEDGQPAFLRETITRCYDYADETGRVVLKVFRTDAKSFPVIHLDGGSWYWGDGGHSMILYRLPQVLAAAAAGGEVWVVEGEKDVETMEAMGYVATCNKGGAGKWDEKLSAALAGARVVVSPDIDEPGIKHGQAVAKALEGYAREIRLVNLRKQQMAALPSKGDVSDLYQQLGAGAAKDVLEGLRERAVVLYRKVSDADYEEYFSGVKGCKVQNGCICHFTGGDWTPLSNFVALPIEQALVDDGNGETRYQIKVAGWSCMGVRLRTLTMTAETFGRMDWPLTGWGLAANMSESPGARARLRRMVQEAGARAAVHRTVYAHTGWRKVGGKWCFLHGTGAIGADGIDVQLDYSFDRYALDGLRSGPWLELPEEMRRTLCQAAALQAMEIGTLRLGAPVVGYMFLSPLRHFLQAAGRRPSFIPFLRGKTQSGKSSFASFLLNFFGYDWGYEASMPANFENTANSISLKMFMLKDLPLLVDDYHPQSDPVKARAMAAVAENISRMIGDGAIRDRMKADGTAQPVRPVRSLCIETGEETPRMSPSGIGRLYVVDVHPGDVPIPRQGGTTQDKRRSEDYMDLLKRAREGALNEVMKGYIEWLIPQADDLPRMLDERLEGLRKEAMDRMAGEAKGRMITAISYIMLGLQMMLEYMCQPGGAVTPEGAETLMARCWDAVIGTAGQQEREMRLESPTEIFVTTVRELLQSGRCVVLSSGDAGRILPVGMIGYKDDNFYYLNPTETFGAVQRSLDAQGEGLPLGKNTVMRMLAEEGKLLKDDRSGKHVRQYNRGGVRGWMMWIPRRVIDDMAPVEQLAMAAVEDDTDNPFTEEKGAQ